MIKIFWRLYTLLALWVFALWPFGGVIQEAVAPIRTEQAIMNVVRSETPPRLCWEWHSRKNINVVSTGIDVSVDLDKDHFSTTVYERDTHQPWASSRAVSVGTHVQPYCIDLPFGVHPSDKLIVHQTILYPGWLHMWTVHVPIPDVIDDPSALS